MLDETVINKLPSTLIPELTATIQQNQAIHRPKLPYCAWRVVSDVPLGLAAIGDKASATPNETVTEFVETVQQAVIEFNFYSDTIQSGATKEARSLCLDFLNKLDLTDSKMTLHAAGIGLLSKRGFTNIDEHLGDDWERRSVCELTVNYILSNEADIPFISDALAGTGVSGTYVNVDGTELT